MVKLTTEQLIYLLYAKAYSEPDTVTKGNVKSYLPKAWKGTSEKIYEALQTQKLISPANRGRFAVTKQGVEALVSNLVTTDYKFDSVKGPKVLNTLLACIRKSAEIPHQVGSSKEMSFDEFEQRFKTLYFEERRQQELKGVVAIHSQDICRKFIKQNSISQENLNQYFESLKTSGKLFAVNEEGNELIQWVE